MMGFIIVHNINTFSVGRVKIYKPALFLWAEGVIECQS